MGLSLSRESKFYELKSNVGSLLQTIESAGKDAGQTASDCSSSLAELPFGSWDDDISTTLKNYCLSVKAGMDEVSNDISGGSFLYLKTAVSDLVDGLGQCAKVQSNYFHQSDRLRTVSDDKERSKINKLVDAEGRNLDKCISYCNDIVNTIEAIQFNGIVTYTPGGGASGLENVEELQNADSGEDSESKFDTSNCSNSDLEGEMKHGSKEVEIIAGSDDSPSGGNIYASDQNYDTSYQIRLVNGRYVEYVTRKSKSDGSSTVYTRELSGQKQIISIESNGHTDYYVVFPDSDSAGYYYNRAMMQHGFNIEDIPNVYSANGQTIHNSSGRDITVTVTTSDGKEPADHKMLDEVSHQYYAGPVPPSAYQ